MADFRILNGNYFFSKAPSFSMLERFTNNPNGHEKMVGKQHPKTIKTTPKSGPQLWA